MRLEFPEGFLWGTSTASAQIETASDHIWKGVKAKDGYVFDRTIDHEKRRLEDLSYITKFGSVYRCGVDWARLQKGPQQSFDRDVVEEYRNFFSQLTGSGMKIMFVFHHFAHPIWFEEKGGWLVSDNIPLFLDYCQRCIEHFGEFVAYWNTFNEPAVFTLNGYVLGNFPPGKKSIFKANRALKNMGWAHDILYGMLKDDSTSKPVGISKNTCWFHGLDPLGKLIAGFTHWWFNVRAARFFKQLDFWGMSYYAYIPFAPFAVTEIDRPGKLRKMLIPHDKMWGYKPAGMLKNLLRLHKKYKKPMMITESGICTVEDRVRQQSLKDYLQICHQAIKEGVDLKGFIYWSTFDNFEWNLGPTYRFGLIEVNMETMERSMTDTGRLYTKIASENAVEI